MTIIFKNHSPLLVGCDAHKIMIFGEKYKSLSFNLGPPSAKKKSGHITQKWSESIGGD